MVGSSLPDGRGSDPSRERQRALSRKAVWLLPALLVLVVLIALLVLTDGGFLSALGYKSF
jgi:hypothetical protein